MTKHSKRPDAEVAPAKYYLCELVAGGTLMTDAAKQLGVSWRELTQWRSSDSEFSAHLAAARAHLAETMADDLARIYERIPCPKTAQVVSNNLKWRLEKMAPLEFGPKPEPPREDVTLIEVLRGAIRRIEIPERHELPAIELKPTRIFRDEPEEHHQP